MRVNVQIILSRCKVANECLNVCDRLELVERNKDDPLPSPTVLWLVIIREKKPWLKKSWNLFHFLIFMTDLLVILAACKIFFTISKCYKVVYFNSFFPCTAEFKELFGWECFSLTYDLNGFKCKVDSYFHVLFIFVFLFFCNLMPFIGCSSVLERISIKRNVIGFW